jgi:uncharacterized membrane protein YfcA
VAGIRAKTPYLAPETNSSPFIQFYMAGNATFRTALLITAVVGVLAIAAGYLFFPKLIQEFVQWLVGLLVVVLGLFFRKKK